MNRERSERRKKLRKLSILGINNHRSAAVRGARAGCAPPPGSASVMHNIHFLIMNSSKQIMKTLFFWMFYCFKDVCQRSKCNPRSPWTEPTFPAGSLSAKPSPASFQFPARVMSTDCGQTLWWTICSDTCRYASASVTWIHFIYMYHRPTSYEQRQWQSETAISSCKLCSLK